jgi:hypothetical protein
MAAIDRYAYSVQYVLEKSLLLQSYNEPYTVW